MAAVAAAGGCVADALPVRLAAASLAASAAAPIDSSTGFSAPLAAVVTAVPSPAACSPRLLLLAGSSAAIAVDERAEYGYCLQQSPTQAYKAMQSSGSTLG